MAITIKAQFNPNTLKASFVVGNDTAQIFNPIGNDCGFCTTEETPAVISIRFTGLTNCDCCYGGGGVNDWYWPSDDLAAALNGNDYTLTQTGDPCIWSTAIDGDWGTMITGNEDCVTEGSSTALDLLRISVTKVSNVNVIIEACLVTSPLTCYPAARFFFYNGNPTIADCIDCTVNNDITVCQSIPPICGAIRPLDGSAQITEIV